MAIEIGGFGVWGRVADLTVELAREGERLGYGAVWAGGSPPGDLEAVERMLVGTERIPVATGIVNMWRVDPATLARSYHRIEDSHPGRLLLGLGIGHPEAIGEYRRPYDTMVEYLEDITTAGVPPDRIVLAALGPRVLSLSAKATLGAHPYLTTPRHTRMAREVMGEGPLLAPEQKVVLHSDEETARAMGRANVSRYLRLVNYRNNLLREGWSESELADEGSDRLVDDLVLHGRTERVAEGIRAHLDAGANHVAIQVLGDDPTAAYQDLAGVLFR